MKQFDFAKLYLALGLFHLAVIYRGEGGTMLWLSKPLILVSLIIYLISKKEVAAKAWGPLLLAFFASLAGDVFLMIKPGWSFLVGMASFGLAHLFFIWAHWIYRKPFKGSELVVGLLVVLPLLFVLLRFTDLPEELFTPILAYFVLISSHLLIAIQNRKNVVPGVEAAGGILLFVLSDLIIALERFGTFELPAAPLLIMSTYILAQGLILRGFLKKESFRN